MKGFSQEVQHEFLLKGILVTLEADASPESVAVIQAACVETPFTSVRELALLCLERMAQEGNSAAIDATYRLAVEDNLLAARQWINSRGWQPSRPTLRALYDWFTQPERPASLDALTILTQAFFEDASPHLQDRMLAGASQKGMDNWALIVTSCRQPGALTELIERYPTFSEDERQLALNRLAKLAASGDPDAQRAIPLLFVRHEDPSARQLALSKGYLPEDAAGRALFFFLAGAWVEYESLDFDHSLLTTIYETGSRSLRRRLLEHSRSTGQMEWLRGVGSSGEVRWPGDLTDADWELAIRRLEENERYPELWRLVQAAPPVWAVTILNRLAQSGWLPDTQDEREGFAALSTLGRECRAAPLAIRPRKSLSAPAGINCLAINPSGKLLAAGSTEQPIYTWTLPDGMLRKPPLTGPAPVVRAVAFSPDGEHLASAAGDHRVRIFRLQDGVVLKTLNGHRALIRSLVIHPDGRMLVSAGFDGTIRLWRFPHGTELKTLRTGQEEIFSLAMSGDGNFLMSAGADRLVSVWALPEGRLARQMSGHADTITNLAISRDGELVASAGRDGVIRVWNYISGGLVRAVENGEGPLTALVLHPNEHVLIGARSTGDILIWNLSTGKQLEKLTGHQAAITGLAISPQGDDLYSVDTTGRLFAWDLRTFLTVRLAGEIARPGSAAALQERLKNPNLTPSEKKWMMFTAELARWRQRFDIELGEFDTIQIGEFDIEL